MWEQTHRSDDFSKLRHSSSGPSFSSMKQSRPNRPIRSLSEWGQDYSQVQPSTVSFNVLRDFVAPTTVAFLSGVIACGVTQIVTH